MQRLLKHNFCKQLTTKTFKLNTKELKIALEQIKQTLGKNQRIKHKRTMEALFKTGKNLRKHPIKLIYLKMPKTEILDKQAFKFAATVPKRIFKNAVDRNEVRRKIKEAFRTNASTLTKTLKAQQSQIALMFIYTSNKKESYHKIEKVVINLLNELIEKQSKNKI